MVCDNSILQDASNMLNILLILFLPRIFLQRSRDTVFASQSLASSATVLRTVPASDFAAENDSPNRFLYAAHPALCNI